MKHGRTSVGLAAALGTVLVIAGVASAAVIDDVLLTGGGGTEWDAANGATAYCMKGEPTGFTPVDNGETTNRSDAFDGGLMLLIEGDAFKDGDGEGTQAGETLRAGPRRLQKLRVSVTARALQTSPTLQVLYALKNPRNHPISRRVALDSNLGSDDQTIIQRTSSGDERFRKSDRWIVTSESDDPLGIGIDPAVTHVLYGKRAGQVVVKPPEVPEKPCSPGDYTDGLVAAYDVSVPRHATRYLLFFAEMTDSSNSDAIQAARKFNDSNVSPALLRGIRARQRSRILNWDL